jgi:isocitrate dehydrogenase kinase/phosphatase
MQYLSNTTAQKILDGFDRYYLKFLTTCKQAKDEFITRDWDNLEQSAIKRISLYDKETKKFCQSIAQNIDLELFNEKLWIKTKHDYLNLLLHHPQPELAETFYNSVFCCLFDKRFYNNNFIFVKPGKSTTYIDIENPVITSYYVTQNNLNETIQQILNNANLGNNYTDLNLDIERLVEQFTQKNSNLIADYYEIKIANSLFIRRKTAYIIGQVISKNYTTTPLAIAINNKDKGVFVDALITGSDGLSAIFSFSRSYFFVNTTYPAGVVDFLKMILPHKSKAELYSCLGLHKHGKTLLYRKFLQYSKTTGEKLIIAPGIKGMVMSVFTFPMFPYVFKIINDSFAKPKNTTKEKVKQNYFFIKNHGRIGRLADTWEFSNVAFSLDYIDKELLTELQTKAASNISIKNNLLIVKHLYMENKMMPLNIYLQQATDEQLKNIIIEYGRAIDELINANIFPGDMLTKNFGLTRQNRVVFYDYDEITTMDIPVFRNIPQARNEEDEMRAEPWYSVGENDVFPEEFKFFMFSNKKSDEIFLKHYGKLLQASYWQEVQQNIKQGKIKDYYPYNQEERMGEIYK